MRAGTQTLIQALQALPWMTSDNDEDGPNNPGSTESDSDDDERPTCKWHHVLGNVCAHSYLLQ
jgi:sterol 3beta-glucosyltransferase